MQQIIQFKRSLPTYRYWKKKLHKDPLFNLSSVDRGLMPRPTSPTRTAEQRLNAAERIIDAYHFASRDQASQPAVYKVSNAWVPIFRRPLQPLLSALERKSAIELRDLLDNFFRNSISQGLIGLASDMAGTFFERKPSRYMRTQFLIDSVYRYRLLQELLPSLKVSDLHIEDFGNPYGFFVDDHFLRNGVDYQYYYANRVSNLLKERPGRSTVLELGGGIGGFAYFLSRIHGSELKYINLDLPEILCISSYQLLNLFPEKEILLYGETERIDSRSISNYDISLLPSFAIESLDADSIDISFNSYSLSEMDFPTVQNYAKNLSRISTAAILHVNHVTELVGADSFSFEANKFALSSRSRALWNLGRDLDCDEYEFLLERKT